MKKAFTLVELLISIMIFGLIALLMFGTIDNLRRQLDFYKERQRHIAEKNRILFLLRGDFDRPESLKVMRNSDKSYDAVSITGSNRSLYRIDRPYVSWIVLKNDNTLVRLESSLPIALPLLPESVYLVHSDVIAKECEIFRTYESNQSRLIYVRFEGKSPLILQTEK